VDAKLAAEPYLGPIFFVFGDIKSFLPSKLSLSSCNNLNSLLQGLYKGFLMIELPPQPLFLEEPKRRLPLDLADLFPYLTVVFPIIMENMLLEFGRLFFRIPQLSFSVVTSPSLCFLLIEISYDLKSYSISMMRSSSKFSNT
jgi:hypothetical protein